MGWVPVVLSAPMLLAAAFFAWDSHRLAAVAQKAADRSLAAAHRAERARDEALGEGLD